MDNAHIKGDKNRNFPIKFYDSKNKKNITKNQ